jgi:hypothetical protein
MLKGGGGGEGGRVRNLKVKACSASYINQVNALIKHLATIFQRFSTMSGYNYCSLIVP